MTEQVQTEKVRVEVVDTTLSDGNLSSQVQFDSAEMVAVARGLAGAGVDYLEVDSHYHDDRAAGFLVGVKDLPLGKCQVVARGQVRQKDLRAEDDPSLLALLMADVEVVALVGKALPDLVEKALGITPEQYRTVVADSVAFLKRHGRRVFFTAEHCFDGFTKDRKKSLGVLKAALDAGAERLVLDDTNGGALPHQVREVVLAVREELPDARLGVRAMNDGGLAVANTVEAVRSGAVHVQVAVNGLGPRCGTADLVPVVANLALKCGYDVLRDGGLQRLTALSRLVADQAKMNYSDTQPFVGGEAFAHRGGLYHAAQRHDPTAYEHVLPETVGNSRRLVVCDLSGQQDLVEQLAAHDIRLDNEELVRVYTEVLRRQQAGYQYQVGQASLVLLALRMLKRLPAWFETQHYTVVARGNGVVDGDMVEASVKIKVAGTLQHTASEGTGPVNALDLALRKGLQPIYPRLEEMTVTDYAVRVIPNRSGADDDPLVATDSTARRVRVTIQSRDRDGNTWGTLAVSRNILKATWQALVDAFDYKRLRDMKTTFGLLPR